MRRYSALMLSNSQDAKVAKVPIDMTFLTAVNTVNGPLEMELKLGQRSVDAGMHLHAIFQQLSRMTVHAHMHAHVPHSRAVRYEMHSISLCVPFACTSDFTCAGRSLRLKATDMVEHGRWMAALTNYLHTYAEERGAAVALSEQQHAQAGGWGVRDLDGGRRAIGSSARHTAEGWVYRQDTDMLRRWRKWWLAVGHDELTCTLYDSLKVSEECKDTKGLSGSLLNMAGRANNYSGERQDKAGPNGTRNAASGDGVSGGSDTRSNGTRDDSTRENLSLDGRMEENISSQPQPVPCRIAQTVALPLATINVREARGYSQLHVFEVISPQQTIVLQVDNQEELAMWTGVLQNATARSLGCAVRTPRMSSASIAASPWGRVRATDGNQSCADCGDSHPAWASINIGVVVCLACAGVHRQLGVHISKVRSMELDTKEWSVPLLNLMVSLGNTTLNGIWQSATATRADLTLISSDVPAVHREAFIRQKYEAKGLLDPASRPVHPALHVAALLGDVPLAATCIAHGFDIDEPAPCEAVGEWDMAMASAHGSRTALQIAAAIGNETVTAPSNAHNYRMAMSLVLSLHERLIMRVVHATRCLSSCFKISHAHLGASTLATSTASRHSCSLSRRVVQIVSSNLSPVARIYRVPIMPNRRQWPWQSGATKLSLR